MANLTRRVFLVKSANIGIVGAVAAGSVVNALAPSRSLAELDLAFQRCGVVAKPWRWSTAERPVFCFVMSDDDYRAASALDLWEDYATRRKEFRAFIMAQPARPSHPLD